MDEVTRALDELCALATRATRTELRRAAFASLDRFVGFDVGVMWAPEPQDAPEVFGAASDFVAHYAAGRAHYAPTVARLMRAAAAEGGVVEDNALWDAATRARLPLYRELGGLLGARQHLTVCLQVGGACVSQMYLTRTGRLARPFGAARVALLRRFVPVLALSEAVLGHPAQAAPEGVDDLTAREREVLELFTLGATYDETARALGVSANTVREHVRQSYRKLHVASKTEAAMALTRSRRP